MFGRFRLISGERLAISSSLKLNSQDKFLSSLSSTLSDGEEGKKKFFEIMNREIDHLAGGRVSRPAR